MDITSPAQPPNHKLDALRAYFASGWLFFLPYLAFYLFFWWNGTRVPTAVAVFWILHAIHLACLIAVLVRFRDIFKDPRLWFFVSVGVVFLIQGAYMEFPSDNWTHARRIYIWNLAYDFNVYVFYEKYKSGFFFLYSLIGWVPFSARFIALSICSALIAVLLCYQIWRFLRACSFGDVSAFLGVLAAVLFMGTPIQFFGYYTLSSSAISMIAVFAALAALLSAPRFRILLSVLAFILATYNHFQGTALIVLGVLGIACWHCQRRFGSVKTLTVLGGAAVLLFAAGAAFVNWIPAGKAFWAATAELRAQGWLSSVGSIRVWDFASLDGEGAATRFLEIVTWLGLLNFAAAAILVWRRKVLGWITLAPLVAVLHPVSATLIAYLHRFDSIITYHRYLLLILPLAAVIELASMFARRSLRFRNLGTLGKAVTASAAAAAILISAIPDERHWLGKFRKLGNPLPDTARLAFLDPIVHKFIEDEKRFAGRSMAIIADPATATYIATHLGYYSDQFRLAVNDSENPVFANIGEIENLIEKFPPPWITLCIIVPKEAPELPLYYSPTGSVTRHWRTFAINEIFQFDPKTLAWCEENLKEGWEQFDLGPWHRCYVRFGHQAL